MATSMDDVSPACFLPAGSNSRTSESPFVHASSLKKQSAKTGGLAAKVCPSDYWISVKTRTVHVFSLIPGPRNASALPYRSNCCARNTRGGEISINNNKNIQLRIRRQEAIDSKYVKSLSFITHIFSRFVLKPLIAKGSQSVADGRQARDSVTHFTKCLRIDNHDT